MTEAQRHEYILDPNDTAAAAQILSWIARPHRQAGAERLLRQFVMKSAQLAGWAPPNEIKLEKPTRLETQILNLQGDILKAFEAAHWFQTKVLRGDGSQIFSGFPKISQRSLAARWSGYRKDEASIGPVMERLWKRREQVVHMCLAAGNAIGKMHHERGQQGFDLRLPMFHADEWVGHAIAQAEGWARTSNQFGIVEIDELIHFRR
jgi:hypothetical protein